LQFKARLSNEGILRVFLVRKKKNFGRKFLAFTVVNFNPKNWEKVNPQFDIFHTSNFAISLW